MDNMEIYNKVNNTPANARKTIQAGRLKGFTDINPMFRIKRLTEVFGACGFGWYYSVTNKGILDGANGEQIAYVDISLYVKVGDEWSKAIYGTGGSSFISKEKSGFYTSDECFKMALTDALSVACKNLGMCSDIYYEKDESKYNNKSTNIPNEPAKVQPKPISEAQVKLIHTLLNGDEERHQKILKYFKVQSIKDLNSVQAKQCIEILNTKETK